MTLPVSQARPTSYSNEDESHGARVMMATSHVKMKSQQAVEDGTPRRLPREVGTDASACQYLPAQRSMKKDALGDHAASAYADEARRDPAVGAHSVYAAPARPSRPCYGHLRAQAHSSTAQQSSAFALPRIRTHRAVAALTQRLSARGSRSWMRHPAGAAHMPGTDWTTLEGR